MPRTYQPRRYTITVGAARRTATTRRYAEVAMGRLMADAPIGAAGIIELDGEFVLQAECVSLGWVKVGRTVAEVAR